MKLRYLPLLLPALAFADSGTQRYACDDGSRLDVSISTAADGRPSARLEFAEGTAELPMVPAASGARYRADPLILHTQDDEALFDDGKGHLRRCTKGEAAPPANTAPAAPSSFIELSGSVAYRSRLALPAASMLSIRIQDKPRAGAPARTLVEQRYELNGAQVPIAFSATVDRDLLGRRSQLVATARIEYRGRLLFVSDKAYPLFKDGQPLNAEIQLKPARPAPAR